MSTLPPVGESKATSFADPCCWEQRQSATLPPADVRAVGGDASAGLQAGTHRRKIRGAGRTHRLLSRIAPRPSKCFILLCEHQAGAQRFLLWLWWVAGSSKKICISQAWRYLMWATLEQESLRNRLHSFRVTLWKQRLFISACVGAKRIPVRFNLQQRLEWSSQRHR